MGFPPPSHCHLNQGVPTRNQEQPESQAPSAVSWKVLRKNHAIDPATLCEGGFEGMSKLQIFINKNKYLRWTPGSPIGVVAKSSRNASEPEDSAGLMGLTVIRALPGSKIDSRRPHFHCAKHALHRNMESERPRKRTKNFAADDSLPRTNNLTNKSRRLVKDLAWRSAGIAMLACRCRRTIRLRAEVPPQLRYDDPLPWRLTLQCRKLTYSRIRRGGRVAEGGGLLNLPAISVSDVKTPDIIAVS